MTADTTVSASFAGLLDVTNISSSDVNVIPGAQDKATPVLPDANGSGAQDLLDAVPYGTAVTLTGSNAVNFEGNDCSAAQGGTVTSTECSFTMSPGDQAINLDFNPIIVTN